MTTDYKNNGLKFTRIMLALCLLVTLGAVSVLNAEEQTTAGDALDELAYGEVKAVLEYEKDLFLVLVELPITFRITDETTFVSNGLFTVTKGTAKTMLVGKGVRLKQHLGKTGEYIADEITVLSNTELIEIKKEQKTRIGKVAIKQKDSMRKN